MTLHLTNAVTRQMVELVKLPAIVGRDPSADICFQGPSVAPYQCMIGQDDDHGLILWNLRDDFPVCVNGQAVTKASLSPGDIVTIGGSEYILG
jgi:hypothetical protein